MISIIVAATKNRMIGKDNDFPWYLSNDLKRFRQLTTGHTIIMGRKTFDHLLARVGKLLPNRTHIVVTRNREFFAEGVIVAHSVEEALRLAHAEKEEVFVIGGAQLYTAALPLADRIYLTEVDAELEGDAYFPEINHKRWREVEREAHVPDEKHDYNYSFVTLEKHEA
ncbi:MAG TPA: dihydrofolate reductase [Candidatus Saccharimonadales bacterium]